MILHYAYAQLSDVVDKAAKSCPDAKYLAAARRGDRAKVELVKLCNRPVSGGTGKCTGAATHAFSS